MEITREIQVDTGHRIPFHKAKCYNVHGHRYRIIATVEGTTVDQLGISDHGMVMDFGDLKSILMHKVHDIIDHGFIVWKDDTALKEFLQKEGYRVVVFEDVPTAENIARWAFYQMKDDVKAKYGNQMRLKTTGAKQKP